MDTGCVSVAPAPEDDPAAAREEAACAGLSIEIGWGAADEEAPPGVLTGEEPGVDVDVITLV